MELFKKIVYFNHEQFASVSHLHRRQFQNVMIIIKISLMLVFIDEKVNVALVMIQCRTIRHIGCDRFCGLIFATLNTPQASI